MQPALVATAVIVGVAAFVTLIVWLIRLQVQSQKETDLLWRAYATRRHLKWIDPSGPWYRRKGYALVGDIDGVPTTFDQFTVSNGKSTMTYSRVSAELARAIPERLIVCRKAFLARLNFAFQGPIVDLDKPQSRERLHVRCRSEALARSIVDNDFRAAFHELPKQTYVEFRDRQAKVWWNGAERDPAVLDRASAFIVSVARAAARA